MGTLKSNRPAVSVIATASVAPGEESLSYTDAYPVVLGGRTYLMRIGHAAVGWRVFPNSVVILYSLRDGMLVSSGTAIVAEKRGRMLSVESAPTRSRLSPLNYSQPPPSAW